MKTVLWSILVSALLVFNLFLTTDSVHAEAGVHFGNNSSNEQVTLRIDEEIPATLKTPGHWEIIDFVKNGKRTVGVLLEARDGLAPGYKNASIIPFAKGARIPGEDKTALRSDHPYVFKINESSSQDYNAPDFVIQKYNRAGITRVAETFVVGKTTHTSIKGKATPELPKGYRWKEVHRQKGGAYPPYSLSKPKEGFISPDLITYTLDYDFSKIRFGEKMNDRFIIPAIIPSFLWMDSLHGQTKLYMQGASDAFQKEFGRAPFQIIPLDMAPFYMNGKNSFIKPDFRPKALLGKTWTKSLPRAVRNAKPKRSNITLPSRRATKFR